MSEIRFSDRFSAAVERVFAFIAETDPGRAATHVETILDGIQILVRHPLIGRRAEGRLRELVVGRSTRCYIVLYTYDAAADQVIVLTVRHASQAGWRD